MSRRRAQEPEDPSKMSFMQAVTAWVFGEGDANAGFNSARWAAAAKYIQAHGGVVTAEEMRPFLDHPDPCHPQLCPLRLMACKVSSKPSQSADLKAPVRLAARHARVACANSHGGLQDEADVLPLVVRLHGEAIIDDGHLLYRFPELQKRTQGGSSRPAGLAGRVASALGLGSSEIKNTSYVGDYVALQGARTALPVKICMWFLTPLIVSPISPVCAKLLHSPCSHRRMLPSASRFSTQISFFHTITGSCG